MSYYINIKCPKCRFSFSSGYRQTGIKSNLGLPFLKCPNCELVCKTENKIYSMMTPEEKSTYISSRIVQSLINAFGIFIGLFVLAIATGIIDENELGLELCYPYLVVIGILSILCSFLLSYFVDKRCIKKLEKIYHNKAKDYFANID